MTLKTSGVKSGQYEYCREKTLQKEHILRKDKLRRSNELWTRGAQKKKKTPEETTESRENN